MNIHNSMYIYSYSIFSCVFSGHGHKLFMDNFYNSVKLSRELVENGTHVCGTLRTNRGEPPAIKAAANGGLQKGERLSRQDGRVMVVAWRDKRVVKMVSTFHQNDTEVVHVRQRGRSDRVPLEKPKCIADYNRFMNGVDRVDQQVQYHPFIRKTVKWPKKYMFYMFQLCFHNAFIIFQHQQPSSKVDTLYKFMMSVVKSWCQPFVDAQSARGRPSSPSPSPDSAETPLRPRSPCPPPVLPSPSTFTPSAPRIDSISRLDGDIGRHVLESIVGRGKKKHATRQCRVCTVKFGKRSETRYVCSRCRVPLHKGQCFSIYHSSAHL